MYKAFPRPEVLISKGERFTNFLLPQSVSGRTKFIQAQDIYSDERVNKAMFIANIFFVVC